MYLYNLQLLNLQTYSINTTFVPILIYLPYVPKYGKFTYR